MLATGLLTRACWQGGSGRCLALRARAASGGLWAGVRALPLWGWLSLARGSPGHFLMGFGHSKARQAGSGASDRCWLLPGWGRAWVLVLPVWDRLATRTCETLALPCTAWSRAQGLVRSRGWFTPWLGSHLSGLSVFRVLGPVCPSSRAGVLRPYWMPSCIPLWESSWVLWLAWPCLGLGVPWRVQVLIRVSVPLAFRAWGWSDWSCLPLWEEVIPCSGTGSSNRYQGQAFFEKVGSCVARGIDALLGGQGTGSWRGGG